MNLYYIEGLKNSLLRKQDNQSKIDQKEREIDVPSELNDIEESCIKTELDWKVVDLQQKISSKSK